MEPKSSALFPNVHGQREQLVGWWRATSNKGGDSAGQQDVPELRHNTINDVSLRPAALSPLRLKAW